MKLIKIALASEISALEFQVSTAHNEVERLKASVQKLETDNMGLKFQLIEVMRNMTQTNVSDTLLDVQKTFAECNFGLDRRLSKDVAKLRFVHPTLGKDLIVRARTGSGKTTAFALPLLHKILQHKQDKSNAEPAVRALV
ncbi:hypothetical protein PsorP6_002415 [Peronosclerospora sorghi]|uniref:Uncharacterized protein n=1 Tax=Peronosclerospora sorghi TaxID=230839 RepID=A0ACC0WW00_9STRA|nr:hypothetical protein PsorP6_002415 [Peronosclerospora sorghi]